MPSQPQSISFTLRSTILDRPRQLTLCPEYLEFDDNDLADAAPTRFLKSEIESLRYGIKGIRGYSFYIGRILIIDIRSTSGQVIKLRLKSLYRIRRKLLTDKYAEIVNALYKYYFHDMVRQYLKLFQDGQAFDILGVSVNADGVLFDNKVGRISWDFLAIRRYTTYYTLFSETNPNQYKALETMEHWNAGVLYSVIKSILESKFPQRKF
jgi:hypothetical protein